MDLQSNHGVEFIEGSGPRNQLLIEHFDETTGTVLVGVNTEFSFSDEQLEAALIDLGLRVRSQEATGVFFDSAGQAHIQDGTQHLAARAQWLLDEQRISVALATRDYDAPARYVASERTIEIPRELLRPENIGDNLTTQFAGALADIRTQVQLEHTMMTNGILVDGFGRLTPRQARDTELTQSMGRLHDEGVELRIDSDPTFGRGAYAEEGDLVGYAPRGLAGAPPRALYMITEHEGTHIDTVRALRDPNLPRETLIENSGRYLWFFANDQGFDIPEADLYGREFVADEAEAHLTEIIAGVSPYASQHFASLQGRILSEFVRGNPTHRFLSGGQIEFTIEGSQNGAGRIIVAVPSSIGPDPAARLQFANEVLRARWGRTNEIYQEAGELIYRNITGY